MKRTALYFQILGLLVSAHSFAQQVETPDFNSTISKWENKSQKETLPVTLVPDAQSSNRTQPFTIRGKILDAESGQPLSYATISVNRLGIGTASNLDGEWSLRIPADGANDKLTINFMGYISQNHNIADLPEINNFKLTPKSFEISEVVIDSRDYIKELLGKAYKEIPSNYPVKPTSCEGFYRETQRVHDSLFLYFNEAMLEVYKNTYKNNTNFGQIRIEKSRKNVFPGIDSINDVRFYGGPHFPNDLDIVFSRWDFIKPSEYKNWVYEIAGIFKDSISEVYTITFKNRKAPNSNFQGKMFIDRNSLAYIGFELRRAGLSTVSSAQITPGVTYIPGNTTAKIGYSQIDGVYNLGYISYKTNGFNTISKTRIYKDIEYVTTSVKSDTVSPIPFAQQFDYTDILSLEAENYDQSYWKDYNILQESKLMSTQTNLLYQKEQAMAQLTKVYNTELTEQEKVLLFLKRFTFDGGISYNPIQYSGGQHNLSWGNATANKSISTKHFGISTMDGIRFDFTKKLSAFTRISTALYGIEQIQFDLGMNYRLSVIPSGRWFFLDLSLAATGVNSKIDLCSMSNPDGNLQVDGKKFKSSSILVKAGASGFGVKPIIGLAVRMGKRYELFMDGSYLLPFLLKKEYIQFKEASGPFFKRKSAKISWSDPNLNFLVDNERITSPRFKVEPYQLRIGIRSGF